MAKLSMWIPPFSPDYSGAAAVLFDLNTVTAMHDAAGCTGNYTGYDEPRWYGSKSAIFCSGLRRIDAIMGSDDKLENKMKAAAADIHPDILALIGSPVPMVIGTDTEGIAAQLEADTGIPSFGFDTTGTAYYDKGAFMAAKALLSRFCKKSGTREAKRVNIIGALPMDFGLGADIENLKNALEQHGYQVGLNLAMGYTLEDLRDADKASVNLAVSHFGWMTARFMEEKWGIPYLCGFPAGEKGEACWFSALQETEQTGKSRIVGLTECTRAEGKQTGDNAPNLQAVHGKVTDARRDAGKTADGLCADAGDSGSGAAEVLIIGEQVMSNALRTAMETDFGVGNIAVGCLYGLETALARPCDLNLSEEKKIRAALRNNQLKLVVGDPFLKLVPELSGTAKPEFLPFVQYAVSSKLGQAQGVCVEGRRFNKWFQHADNWRNHR